MPSRYWMAGLFPIEEEYQRGFAVVAPAVQMLPNLSSGDRRLWESLASDLRSVVAWLPAGRCAERERLKSWIGAAQVTSDDQLLQLSRAKRGERCQAKGGANLQFLSPEVDLMVKDNPWTFHGHSMDIPCTFHGHSMDILWTFYGHCVVILCIPWSPLGQLLVKLGVTLEPSPRHFLGRFGVALGVTSGSP